MNRRLNRHDLSYLISAVLIAVGAVTAATGLVSDLWDLNDFVYHKYGGYILAVLALIHVALHWNRLVSYIRWRLSGHPRVRRSRPTASRRRSERPSQARPTSIETKNNSVDQRGRFRFSRRDLFPLTLGGVAGLALGNLLQPEPQLPDAEDLDVLYHEWSKPKMISFLDTVAGWGRQSPIYKTYENAPRITLPPPGDSVGLYTEETIQRRRSRRNYSGQDMTLVELSRLLYNTAGITSQSFGRKLRAAPSAGALYPIETYLVIHRLQNLEPGLYHYVVKEHAVELLQAGDLRSEIVKHGLMQEFLGQANLVFVFTAIFQRLRQKYQERSYRYALLEAGHLGQNVYLAGTSMGLGACAVGAFLDDDLNTMLGIDGQEEAAVYMLAAGKA